MDAIRRLLLTACLLAVVPGLLPAAAQGQATPASAMPTAAPVLRGADRPAGFRLTAAQAVARARRTAQGRRLLAGTPGVRFDARAPDLGLWVVAARVHGRPAGAIEIEDHTGRSLEPSPWSWPLVRSRMNPFKAQTELILGLMGLLFLWLYTDRRQLVSWRTLDAAVLLGGLGVAFAFFDRGRATVAYPLAFAMVAYLCARAVRAGLAGPTGGARWTPPSMRVLVPLLAGLVAWRTG